MCELLNCTVRIPRLDLDGHPHKIQRKIPNLICRQGRKCASIGTTSIILPALDLFKFIDHLDDKCSPDLINCWSMLPARFVSKLFFSFEVCFLWEHEHFHSISMYICCLYIHSIHACMVQTLEALGPGSYSPTYRLVCVEGTS